MNSVQRFDGKVVDYDRYRERYSPKVLLPILRERCGLTLEWRIADIGAGTGMLSDVFLANGNKVTAIEPNEEMRELCTALHADSVLTVVDATAEYTGLLDASVDMVCAGRAMHWFDLDRSMTEFRRILKPGGWVAIIAFGRSEKGRAENEALEDVLREYSSDHADTHAGYAIYRKLDEYLTRDFYHLELLSSMPMDWETLHGLVMSLSHAPRRDAAGYPAFEQALRGVFDRYANDGIFEIETRYWINLGRFSEEVSTR
jgi:SAM-dependent methyltransferase